MEENNKITCYKVDEDGIAFIYDRTLDTNEMLGFMPLDKAQAIAEEVLKVTKSK